MAPSKRIEEHHSLVAALRHPLRRRILRTMSDGRETSPSELAKELGERLSNVAYHVNVLARCGALKAVGQRKVRGATQHLYRWSLTAAWAREMLEQTEGESPPERP